MADDLIRKVFEYWKTVRFVVQIQVLQDFDLQLKSDLAVTDNACHFISKSYAYFIHFKEISAKQTNI
jgi:hypothetical protein